MLYNYTQINYLLKSFALSQIAVSPQKPDTATTRASVLSGDDSLWLDSYGNAEVPYKLGDGESIFKCDNLRYEYDSCVLGEKSLLYSNIKKEIVVH